jgi:hypothetical protein
VGRTSGGWIRRLYISSLQEKEKDPSGQIGNRYVELVELGVEGDDFSLLLGDDSLFESPFDSLLDSVDEDFDPLPSPFDFPLRA